MQMHNGELGSVLGLGMKKSYGKVWSGGLGFLWACSSSLPVLCLASPL